MATPAAPSNTKVTFGITIDINKKPVSITVPITDLTAEGFNFTLPEPVVLGSLADFEGYLNTKYQINTNEIKSTLESLPAPF